MTCKRPLLPDPLPFVGGYSLDLYCRHEHTLGNTPQLYECNHSFQGRTFSECKRRALGHGWKFHKDGTTTCPLCVRDNKAAS